jgi:hypothetical protein
MAAIFNYIYWVRSFAFGDVHFIMKLCHVTIALVFKLVTWILRHRGLAITVCKAGLHSIWLRISTCIVCYIVFFWFITVLYY